jgi:hypothetical protein
MTNKVEEMRHIQQMIVDGKWQDDKTIEDEINARIWCVVVDKSYNHNHFLGYGYRYSPTYLNSLDAIKGLERSGWRLEKVYRLGDDFVFNYRKDLVLNGVDVYTTALSIPLSDEKAARLYAVLETIIYEEENK